MGQDRPRLDHDAARRALDVSGASLACPSCDGTAWRNLGYAGSLVMLDAVTLDEQPLQAGGVRAGLFVVAFVCGNCGFVRLHSRDELAARLSESSE
jgi:hypothetical protein